jgi:hypothetical protein
MEQGGLRAVHALRVARTSGSAITAHPIREGEVRDERRIGEATFRRYTQTGRKGRTCPARCRLVPLPAFASTST